MSYADVYFHLKHILSFKQNKVSIFKGWTKQNEVGAENQRQECSYIDWSLIQKSFIVYHRQFVGRHSKSFLRFSELLRKSVKYQAEAISVTVERFHSFFVNKKI